MKKNYMGLQRRPFLTPIWLAALAAAVVLSCASLLWGRADSTTVIVIRHAERAIGTGADPPLSAAGQARAALLARMFGDTGPGRISAIYVTPPLRNRMTAAPLAAVLGVTPSIAAGDPRELAHRVLREQPGGRVLIVGHSDTVPQIVAALSGMDSIPAMRDSQYGTMYIVTVPRLGRANLLRLEY